MAEALMRKEGNDPVNPTTASRPKRPQPAAPIFESVPLTPGMFTSKRALKLVLELMSIPGPSGEEQAVVDYIVGKLKAVGVPNSTISTDQAHRRTPINGKVGNLICKLPGTLRGPRRLLVAHLDTVPLAVGARPIQAGHLIGSANKQSGLGADDRSGVAVLLNTVIEIFERKLPYPPLTLLWPVQEEIGLHGARCANIGKLGNPRLAFNWDGGVAEKLTIGATGAYRLDIVVDGLAAHAGGAPERGVSAITIAGLAIADLQQHGWIGEVIKDGVRGTTNVGVIEGGSATNVVTSRVTLRAETRSHDAKFRQRLVKEFEQAFERAAQSVRNVDGVTGKVSIASRLDYESFVLPENDASVQAAESAIRAIGLTPERAISNGGLDANWLTARGIPTVTLGCGQMNPHTTSERLDLEVYDQACKIALRLATGNELSG